MYAFVERLRALSTEELVEEVGELGAGDDYDGAFTRWGQIEFKFAKRLLRERIAVLEHENMALRANTPESILRRLSEQGALREINMLSSKEE